MKISVGKHQVIGLFDERIAASKDSTFLAEYLIRKEEARQRRNAAPARYRRAEREGRRVLVIRTEDGTFVCETIVTPERLRSRIPFVEAEDFTRK